MDGLITQSYYENKRSSSVGAYFAILAALSAILVAIGIKYSSRAEIIDGLSYYGRYEGLGGEFIHHAVAAAKSSAVCLVQLFTLFLFSFSPLLIPAAITVAGSRAFVAGIAYSAVNNTSSAVQLILYAVITAIICFASAEFMHQRKNSGSIGARVITLMAYAGASVIGEFVLSYLT